MPEVVPVDREGDNYNVMFVVIIRVHRAVQGRRIPVGVMVIVVIVVVVIVVKVIVV